MIYGEWILSGGPLARAKCKFSHQSSGVGVARMLYVGISQWADGRLIHVKNNCALRTHSQTLPKWGWEQYEVTCNPDLDDPDNLWNVEMHHNPNRAFWAGCVLVIVCTHEAVAILVRDLVSYDTMAPSFLSSIWELHVAMMQVNNNLIPKENEITRCVYMDRIGVVLTLATVAVVRGNGRSIIGVKSSLLGARATSA
jgi:hypothetical protein